MTESKHGRWRWLHTLEEKWFLPALTAYVANYLLRGQLKPLAEQLPEPWADVIAHPFIEFILDFLLWLAVFLGTLLIKKALKYYALTFYVLVGILHFILLRYAHASKLSLYVLWCSSVWGPAALLLWLLDRATKTRDAIIEEKAHSLVPYFLMPDEDSDDESNLFGEVLTLTMLSVLFSVLATVLLGITLWAGLGLSTTKSIVLSLIAVSLLAIVYRRIDKRSESQKAS